MKSLLIDVVNCEVKEVEITDFHDFYKHIGCSAFDVVGRYIGDENRWFDIFTSIFVQVTKEQQTVFMPILYW